MYIHYGRPRLYLDRSAWDALTSPEDVLVQRIAPRDAPAFTIALTRDELERTFGEVRYTLSWDTVRCYHFPNLPPAVESFRVIAGRGPPAVAPVNGRPPPSTPHRPSSRPPATAPVSRGGTVEAWAARWAARTGGVVESPSYLASVAAWRDSWRPKHVRVLLVAESHVREIAGDARVSVRVPREPHLPPSFCRLVYCLGYGATYPIALEGALKLKEITYAHCEGMLSTEFKHGPLSAVSKGFPIVFVAGPNDVPLIISGINEVKVRGARTIVVAEEDSRLRANGDDLVVIPKSDPQVNALLAVLPLQLLSYHMSVMRGFDPDFPRNLSKTLTVD